MMWAPSVPAPMMYAPPILLLSGSPNVAVVAPGTEMVMCVRTVVASLPDRV